MAWEHLSINKPHLVYIILGGFTTLFMLVSSVIKEKLYIGEATVATICGIIFGPHAADLINPRSWGNEDQITLEFSRIVLVVQCFAVGVELPKAYMERHWKSVTLLLVPVMTFGWLITSLFIWAMFTPYLNWLDSLCCAACVTATDPVLASSVVGKGKFAKRVPKHLRDLLSAESGCNDGMAFPFVYLALYIIRFKHHPDEVAFHWFCYTILYECIFGCFYGVMVGYLARRAIRFAHEKDWIDRESFLVFYFVLALFCAGSGSLLGMDDLLVGFACGVGFSNDGWFTEKTEESHVSNVIDLLINLAFFVYFGTIIPWEQFNAGHTGLEVWRLVVIALLVLFFRRIPIMLALKPIIPDIKTWREALFAGHFGPIGVGAIFVAILARAELETEETTPLAVLPPPGFPHDNIIEVIWPITTFLVLTSIIVHGSSIAVFTLGKHINTLTLTMSYTQAKDPNWMERLPRIQSRSRSSMSIQRSDSEFDEKAAFGPGMLPPVGQAGNFLRRQKEEDIPSRSQSRNRPHKSKRSKNWDSGLGPGGPVSASAIAPAARLDAQEKEQPSSRSDSETLAVKPDSPPGAEDRKDMEKSTYEVQSPGEIFEEGDKTVYEDEEGNVLSVQESKGGESQAEREAREFTEGQRLMREEDADQNDGVAPTKDDPNAGTSDRVAAEAHHLEQEAKEPLTRPGQKWREGMHKMSQMGTLQNLRRKSEAPVPAERPVERRHGPARAYQFGNTIIVEDEDGEVIKKFDIPTPEGNQAGPSEDKSMNRLRKMSRILGVGGRKGPVDTGAPGPSSEGQKPADGGDDDDDEGLRFTMAAGGRRMSKVDFINHIRQMDPRSRAQVVEESNAPEAMKEQARKDVREQAAASRGRPEVPVVPEHPDEDGGSPRIERKTSAASADLQLVDENNQEVPFHDVSRTLKNYSIGSSSGTETAAERRRRIALEQKQHGPDDDSDSEDDGTDRVPPKPAVQEGPTASSRETKASDGGETAAERRRREGALGIHHEEESSSSEDDDEPRQLPSTSRNIRFAEPSVPQPVAQRQQGRDQSSTGSGGGPRLRWGKNTGR